MHIFALYRFYIGFTILFYFLSRLLRIVFASLYYSNLCYILFLFFFLYAIFCIFYFYINYCKNKTQLSEKFKKSEVSLNTLEVLFAAGFILENNIFCFFYKISKLTFSEVYINTVSFFKDLLFGMFFLLYQPQLFIQGFFSIILHKLKIFDWIFFGSTNNKDKFLTILTFFCINPSNVIDFNSQFFTYNILQNSSKYTKVLSNAILMLNSSLETARHISLNLGESGVINKLFTKFILFSFKNTYFKKSTFIGTFGLKSIFFYIFFETPFRNIFTINFFFFKNFIKTTFICIFVFFIFFFFNLFFFKLNFTKYLAIWFSIVILFFWLISGFTFFLKKGKFGKFTSAVQRFWKRANIAFWFIEGFLFVLFFYYYINASQEPLYMYDISALNKDFTFDLSSFYFSSLLLIFIVFALLFLQVHLANLNWRMSFFILFLVYFAVLYLFFIESYQFYYLMTKFFTKFWFWDETTNLWILETETPRTRTKTSYFQICLIAKYWHFLFIFLSWFFIFSKILEQKFISITLVSINLQNFIFLFFLNLLCYLLWFRCIFRKFYDNAFYWFFNNFQIKIFKIIFYDFLTFFI